MERVATRTLVHRLRYRPGWRFTTKELDDNHLVVEVEIDTVDSAKQDAQYGYPRRITLLRELRVDDLAVKGEVTVAAELLAQCIFIDVHEDREFFRLWPTWDAPFHPHRPDGVERWENAAKHALIDLLRQEDNNRVGERR